MSENNGRDDGSMAAVPSHGIYRLWPSEDCVMPPKQGDKADHGRTVNLGKIAPPLGASSPLPRHATSQQSSNGGAVTLLLLTATWRDGNALISRSPLQDGRRVGEVGQSKAAKGVR